MPVFATDDLQIEYYHLLTLRRQRDISAKQYQLRKGWLVKRNEKELEKQAREEERRVQRERRQAEKARREEEKARRKAEKERRKALGYRRMNVVFDRTFTTPIDLDEADEQIIASLTRLVGKKNAYLQISQGGEIVESDLLTIRGSDAQAIFFNNIRGHLYRDGSDGYNILQIDVRGGAPRDPLVELPPGSNVRVVILDEETIPVERIQQVFRDSDNGFCVLEPLFNLWNKMAENSESEASKKRCGQIARRIKGLESVYPNGVPEDKMEEVAKICHRCIVIHNIVGGEVMRFNKNSSKTFHFTNTRVNHVESGRVTMDKHFESVSQDEMNEIVYEHDKNKEFYLFTGDVMTETPSAIRSAKGAWAVYNKDFELFNNFSNHIGIQNYGIDAIKYSSLNEFVRESRLINSAPTPLCDEPNDLEDVQHIDVSKAYTQHKYAKFFRGFLGHIQQYRKLPFGIKPAEFLEKHVGIFQFVVVSNSNELLSKLGIRNGCKYTLPSVEIEYMIHEYGLDVKLIAGCWGSTFDIEYTEEMLDQRRYCIWAGKLGMDKDCNVYTFKGDSAWASHLKYVLGDEQVLYFREQGIIVVKVPKKSYLTRHHILAFITSYTRMNMLDIMNKVEGELVKVVLDGLYYRGEIPDIEIPHKDNKDIKKHIGFRDAWYYQSEVDISSWTMYNEKLDGSCVLSGAGGTGKTYSVLTDKGFINPLYVVPQHTLGQKGRISYECNYTTIHKLIGEDCRSYKEMFREPGVILIDELTMIEGSWIEKAIAMYPNSLFFIAGDIDSTGRWFQTRNGCPGKFSNVWLGQGWKFVEYTNDMRSRDNELKAFKTDVRRVMKEVFTNGGQFDSIKVCNYVKKNYKTISFDEACSMFQPGDRWIAGTHKVNQKLLEKGIVSGYINKNKEIVSEDSAGAEKRGSFTCHSYQGLTIDSERVFMSLDFFEYAMLYTSISRVRNFNQIVLVH